MRTFSAVASDITPGVLESMRQEFRASREGFAERAKVLAPKLDDDSIAVIQTELEHQAAVRGE